MFTLLNFELSTCLLNFTIFLLIIISTKIILSRDLLETVIYTSAFSILIGISYLLMDAPDVAMTEVALGACLSTCVYLNLLRKLPSEVQIIKKTRIISTSFICLLFIATLTYMGLELPDYGDEQALLHTHLTSYYIENTAKDIGILSFVAAILASYRGFDTLGETSVILIAGISVLIILSKANIVPCVDNNIRTMQQSRKKPVIIKLKAFPIIKNITAFIVPYIILYSLYIQLNGESSPGGGFQAGVIFTSSLISYDLVYGNQKLNRYFSVNTLIIIAALGVIIYGLIGSISFFFNDNYLNYYSLANFINDRLLAQHIGIFAVEIGIGLTVSTIMYLIYKLFNNCE